jgi:hypothetical protein
MLTDHETQELADLLGVDDTKAARVAEIVARAMARKYGLLAQMTAGETYLELEKTHGGS